MMTAVVARERSLAGRRLRYDGAEWTLGDKLGSGRFATVYLAERTAILSPTGSGAKAPRLLAVKVTEAASITSWARMQLVREASIWGGLSHPHIVRMVGHIPAATQHVLLLEHAAGGELFDRIIALQYLSEASAARMLTQLLSAVAYLHANGIAHRDLKPENIVLASTAEDAPLKVADFGAAALLTPGQGLHTPCGSMGYAAPEQLSALDEKGRYSRSLGEQPSAVDGRGGYRQGDGNVGLPLRPHSQPAEAYYYEVDIWAVGVVSYILLCGVMPFDPARYREHPLTVSFPDALFGSVSEGAKDFVASLLRLEPSQRLTANEAVDHPWLLAHGGRATLASSAAIAAADVPVPMFAPPAPLANIHSAAALASRHSGNRSDAWNRSDAGNRSDAASKSGAKNNPSGCAAPWGAGPSGEAGASLASGWGAGEGSGIGLRIDVGNADDAPVCGNTPALPPTDLWHGLASTPHSAASLPTPTHLRALKSSGALKQQWSFNRDPAAGGAGGHSRGGKRPHGASELPLMSGWGTLADVEGERAIPAGGESAAAAGIVTSPREHVPLGAASLMDAVIIELPPMVRRRIRAGSAAAGAEMLATGGAPRSWEEASSV